MVERNVELCCAKITEWDAVSRFRMECPDGRLSRSHLRTLFQKVFPDGKQTFGIKKTVLSFRVQTVFSDCMQIVFSDCMRKVFFDSMRIVFSDCMQIVFSHVMQTVFLILC